MTPEQETFLTTLAGGIMAAGYTPEQIITVLLSAGPQLQLRQLEFQRENLEAARRAANEDFDIQVQTLQGQIDALAAQIRGNL